MVFTMLCAIMAMPLQMRAAGLIEPVKSASAPSGPRPLQACAEWAAAGECRTNSAFMHTQCLLACQKADAAHAPAARPEPAAAAIKHTPAVQSSPGDGIRIIDETPHAPGTGSHKPAEQTLPAEETDPTPTTPHAPGTHTSPADETDPTPTTPHAPGTHASPADETDPTPTTHTPGTHTPGTGAAHTPGTGAHTPGTPATHTPATHPPATPHIRPQVLVIVSDHGSGTTNFGAALDTHPCVFDLGEPFAHATTLWAKANVPECDNSKFPDTIFNADSGALMHSNNPQLTLKMENAIKHNLLPSMNLAHATADMCTGLTYNLADYFVRARDLICSDVPDHICPAADCTITLKFFPQFVNADTPGVLMKDEHTSQCSTAKNTHAMQAWKDGLESFKQNPKVASFTLERNEAKRQFSVFHRFTPAGTEYDCSIPRYATEFANVSKSYTDGLISIEDCWTGAAGAASCLSKALHEVGLDMEPMGKAGTDAMAGTGITHTSLSCTTNPTSIFKRLANDDVQVVNPKDHSWRKSDHHNAFEGLTFDEKVEDVSGPTLVLSHTTRASRRS
jgi:hypothetical protein